MVSGNPRPAWSRVTRHQYVAALSASLALSDMDCSIAQETLEGPSRMLDASVKVSLKHRPQWIGAKRV